MSPTENYFNELSTLLKQTSNDTRDIKHSLLNTSIETFNKAIHINNIHSESYIWSPIILKDKRIATGSDDGSISICSINFKTMEWSQDIIKKNAHKGVVISLCELNNNQIISCSWDKTIKIWKITATHLILNHMFTNHTSDVCCVITLPKNRFASCSEDKTVRIWSSTEPYKELKIINNDSKVFALLYIQSKEMIVSSTQLEKLIFWNVNTYKHEHTIKGYSVMRKNNMVELPNKYLAVSSNSVGYPIVIIDLNSYNVIKVIVEESISYFSSLCLLNDSSFIFIHDDVLIQISIKDFSIKCKTKLKLGLKGDGGIILTHYQNYIITDNKSNGLEVVRIRYE